MPKVPVYEQQVSVQPPSPRTPTLAAPPASAFGAPISEAGARLGSAMENASSGMAKILLEKKQEEQEKQVFQMDSDVRKRVSDMLFSKDTDAKGKPKGLLNRKLGNATGVTTEFDDAYNSMREEVLGGELSDFQRKALTKVLESHYSDTRESLIKHEASQGEADYKNSFEADMKQRIQDAAAITDPAKLQQFVAESLALQNVAYNRLGMDENSRKQGNSALISGIVEASLKDVISTSPAMARQMLGAMKGTLPADVFETLDAKVLDAEFVSKLVTAKDKGAMKQEALKMAADPYFSRNEVEKTARMEAVNKLYAATDYATYMRLWEGAQASSVTAAQIDREFANGRLTQNDAEELRKIIFASKTGSGSGKMPAAVKMVYDQIKIEAEKKYANKQNGKGQKLLDEYMYVVGQKANQTQDPAELMKYAEDLKKDVKVTDGWWFFDTYKPGFEVQYEQQKAQLLQVGTMKSMLGDDVLNGLSRSIIATTGKPEIGITDIGAFVTELDALMNKRPTPVSAVPQEVPLNRTSGPVKQEPITFDSLAQGRPINNAIRSLLAHKKAVTPDAVKAVLEAYPDGNWR